MSEVQMIEDYKYTLQGNIYELPNKWHIGYIWNILNSGTKLSLQGHYSIIFKDEDNFKVYKHGDFASTGVLTSYADIEFQGFETLNKYDAKFIKDALVNTIPIMQKYPYKEGRKLCGSIKVFDWNPTEEPNKFDDTIQKILTNLN